jgi:hypothetical protein
LPSIKLEGFGGQLPAWSDHLLPEAQATVNQNAYLFPGELQGWRQPKLLHSLNNSAAKFAYRVPTVTSASALAFLVFLANPLDGDQVVVGESTYTFKSTINAASPPYQVLIGANASVTAGNLLGAIINSGTGTGTGAGTSYSFGTCTNPVVSIVAGANAVNPISIGGTTYSVMQLTAFDIGVAFNSTPTTESTGDVRMIWLSNTSSLANETETMTGGSNQTYDPTITGASQWLEFLDPDTDVMRSQVVNDTFQRYYFTAPSQPPQYNTYARIAAAQPAFLLGLNPPGCSPGVAVTGGGDNIQLGFPTQSVVAEGSPGQNIIYLVKVTPTGAVTATDIALMPGQTSLTARFAGVIYTDNNGVPFEQLATTPPETGCTAGTQLTMTFVAPVGLLAQAPYWIGFMADTAILIQGSDGQSNGVYFQNTFSSGPPQFITPANVVLNQPDLQVWADCVTNVVLEARSYVYTWVTAYGEESAPSPNTLVTGWSNGVWTVSLFAPLSQDTGILRNVTKVRLYRTVTGSGGIATYFFVADIPVGTPTYVDTVDDSIIALNNILPSTTWQPPPEGLYGLLALPNGMAAAFRNNEVWFCEPYQPHAWPPNYVQTTEFPIVGLGVVGNTLVACTTGHPYAFTGVTPSAMTSTRLNDKNPCISKGSVVSKLDGVYYHSRNGLIQITQTSATNLTESWITREKWAALTPQKLVRAIPFLSMYFAFGCTASTAGVVTDSSVAQLGFTVDLAASDSNSFTIWPQPGGHRIGFGTLTNPNGFNTDNITIDPWSGVTLVLQNGGVYQYDFSDPAPAIVPYTWRSKEFQQTSHKNYSAVRVFFNVPPGTPAQSASPNTTKTSDPSWNTLSPGQYGILRVFADGNLVTCREIRTSGALLRILSGFKADRWKFEFTGIVAITIAKIATTVKETAKV